MTKRKLLKAAAVSLGCLGVMAQSNVVNAAGPVTKTVAKTAAVKTQDVALNKDGVLRGFVVDAQGKPLDSAQVVIKQGRFEIAKTISAKDGSFEVKDLKNGSYVIEAGQGQGVIRVWSERVAPPAAKKSLVMVADNKIVRGQLGFSAITAVIVGGGVVGGAVIVNEFNDVNDDVDDLETENNRLQQRITTLESSP